MSFLLDVDLEQKSRPGRVFATIQRKMPLPPSLVGKITLNQVEDVKNLPIKTNDEFLENEWRAKVLKKNPHVLELLNRIYPLSNYPVKLHDFERTTENKESLSRLDIIQLIYQHLKVKKLKDTMHNLYLETGIEYNGMYSNEHSILAMLISYGKYDTSKIYQVPHKENTYEEVDEEVLTASIYTHLDVEYNPQDFYKNFWVEIFDNEEDNIEIKDDETKIRAASLNRLIDILTSNVDIELKFMETFFLTYRSFTTPEILLKKLLEVFKIPKERPQHITPENWEMKKKIIPIRIGNCIKHWLNKFYRLDWNVKMIQTISTFIEDFLVKNKETQQLAKNLANTLKKEISEEKISSKQTLIETELQRPIVPKNIFHQLLTLDDIDELELARQLTLIEHQNYCKITPVELLNNAWSNSKYKHRASNVIKSSIRFNKISAWIIDSILSPQSLKIRKKNYIRAINILKHLNTLQNFNSLLAFISAFDNSAVFRLKYTKEIDQKLLHDIDKMRQLMTSDKSFKNYRPHLKGVTPPLVPYLGLYLTDLTFVEEGNKEYVPHSQTGKLLINWAKRKLVYTTIHQIQLYQNTPYNIIPILQIQELIEKKLENTIIISNEELYNISFLREPKNATAKDLFE